MARTRTALIQNTMGPMWVTTPAAKLIFSAQTKERNKLTLEQPPSNDGEF